MMIGILVHGRYLQAVDWEKLEWGEPPYILGVLPMMALIVLNTGVDNIAGVIIGAGASEKDGLKESEYTKRFLLQHFDQLEDFELIKSHPRFQSSTGKARLRELFEDIICDTDATNTAEEVVNAAKVFSALDGVSEVKQVTCGSHAPRCQRDQLIVRARGGIPSGQLWSCYGDDMAYAGSEVGDTAIMEHPHRGDDPMVNSPIQAHQVFPEFFKIPGAGNKVDALKVVRDVIQEFIDK